MKEMKLELKHLAPYLPYGLKTTSSDLPIDGICGNRVFFDDGDIYYWISDIKPILRPLSDLTKEIEVNGEKFVPLLELFKILMPNRDLSKYQEYRGEVLSIWLGFGYNERIKNVNYGYDSCYDTQEKLFQWHFDVFGLIEKGLAIDINTLEK